MHTPMHVCTRMHPHPHTPTHPPHTHTIRTVVEMLRKEKCLKFVFEGRESNRVSDVFEEVVPGVKTEVGVGAKAMNFAVLASEFQCAGV